MSNKLGVAIPTYKREEMLAGLLKTIPKNVLVYISDNGGSLGEKIQEDNPNVILKKIVPEVSMFENWNSAASMVEDEWLVVTSDDDIYYPSQFQVIWSALDKYSDMDMLIFGHNIIDADGNVLQSWAPEIGTFRPPEGFVKYKYGINARMPSIIFKNSFFKYLNGFKECFKLTASDSDLIQRGLMVGKVQLIPEIISGYRLWNGGLTLNRISSQEWMTEIDIWCEQMLQFSKEEKVNVYSRKIQDEIYASNLIAGIISARKYSGLKLAWQHFKRCRYPYRARVVTQLRIFYSFGRTVN